MSEGSHERGAAEVPAAGADLSEAIFSRAEGERLHAESAAPVPARTDRDLFGRAPKRTPDWSHRRGEPRWFALGWTAFVLVVTLGSLQSAGGMSNSGGPASYRPSARVLMAVLGVGVAVLWPLVRLSQASPGGGRWAGVRDAARDWVVVQVPVQAVVLPHLVLARWPVAVVAALSASLAVWGAVIGGMLAWAHGAGGSGGRWRGAWTMTLCIALTVLVPGLAGPALPWSGRELPGWWWMLSPASSGPELSRDRSWSGQSAAVGAEHWRAIGWTAGGGALLWAAAGVRAVVGGRERA